MATAGTDAEWLALTTRLLESYKLGITTVRELLLHLGPKQSGVSLVGPLDRFTVKKEATS